MRSEKVSLLLRPGRDAKVGQVGATDTDEITLAPSQGDPRDVL